MPDAHKNFAYTSVVTPPSPAASGTTLTVTSGTGTLFPAVPFNATVWVAGDRPLTTNAEIVRVTNITSDTLTITRAQEGSSARSILAGDQIAATITAKAFQDIEKNNTATVITSAAQPAINVDTTGVAVFNTLQHAVTDMSANLTGTPADGQPLLFRIKSDSSARSIAWGTSFAPRGIALPTTTVANKYLYVGFRYNAVESVWDCIASQQEA